MKNIQVIDAALNCVYDIFAATDEEFAQIFPSSEDVAFIEVYARGEQAKLDEVFRLHGLAGTLRGIAHTSIRTQATVHIMGDVFSKWRDIIGTESLEKYFEGQQNLAAQFLAQFSARLPRESEALRESAMSLPITRMQSGVWLRLPRRFQESANYLPSIGKRSSRRSK